MVAEEEVEVGVEAEVEVGVAVAGEAEDGRAGLPDLEEDSVERDGLSTREKLLQPPLVFGHPAAGETLLLELLSDIWPVTCAGSIILPQPAIHTVIR